MVNVSRYDVRDHECRVACSRRGRPDPRSAAAIRSLLWSEARRPLGRAYPGAFGIARSYEEAREALDLGGKLELADNVAHAEDLLVYRMLLRDQSAIADLIEGVLTPLKAARGGADPLLQTVEAYFVSGGVATAAARQLHLSVRAVTYRLSRVHELTGYDPTNPADWFTLQAAVLGARLLGWPHRALPRIS